MVLMSTTHAADGTTTYDSSTIGIAHAGDVDADGETIAAESTIGHTTRLCLRLRLRWLWRWWRVAQPCLA